jgi:hypothetical protein
MFTCLEIQALRSRLSTIYINFPIFPLSQYFLDSKALHKDKVSFTLMNDEWANMGCVWSHLISSASGVYLPSHKGTQRKTVPLLRLKEPQSSQELLFSPQTPTGLLKSETWNQERSKYLSS